MAYNSVDNLFKQLNLAEIKKVGKLYNTDIPNFSEVMKGKQFIRDQARNVLRATTQPRNQDNLILPRARQINPRLDDFQLDNSINPVYKRAKYDPNSLAPVVSGENVLYGVDPSMREEYNSVSLLQKARASFYNFNNRFNTIAPAPESESVKNLTSTPNAPEYTPQIQNPPIYTPFNQAGIYA